MEINELIEKLNLALLSQKRKLDSLGRDGNSLGDIDYLIVSRVEIMEQAMYCNQTISFVKEYLVQYKNDWLIGCFNSFKEPLLYNIKAHIEFITNYNSINNSLPIRFVLKDRTELMIIAMIHFLKNMIEILKIHVESPKQINQ